MCGFLFLLHVGDLNIDIQKHLSSLSANLKRRGCDYFDERYVSLCEDWSCYVKASVLWTQGNRFEPQPVISENNIFLWNGDIYNMHSERCIELSDTKFIINQLSVNDDVVQLMSKVRGPFSFTYWNERKKVLWIGRDVIGRHSLLWYFSKTEIFVTSVGYKSDLPLVEVPAIGLFAIKFDEKMTIYDVFLYPWSHYQNNEILSYSLPTKIKIKDSILALDYENIDWSTDNIPFVDAYNNFEMSKIPKFMASMLDDKIISSRIIEFLSVLTESVKIRVLTTPALCRTCKISPCNHSKMAILFSGGVDCTVLAVLADQYINEEECIDLLSVAFSRSNSDNFNVPDRKTGLSSYRELKNLCPSRKWNFVEINVSKDELTEEREKHIRHLIYPSNTVLDDSLGCALWFASRGIGTVDNVPYESTARILLSGLGADEQLGGYTRHHTLLKQQGYSSLSKQLFEETLNISRRNLGRDNRITSDHSRQCRFPYLDENIIVYLNKLPPWIKHGPTTLPPGVGDKLLLRLLAWHLGLHICAILPKRAMQFGCRIANSKDKGNSTSVNL